MSVDSIGLDNSTPSIVSYVTINEPFSTTVSFSSVSVSVFLSYVKFAVTLFVTFSLVTFSYLTDILNESFIVLLSSFISYVSVHVIVFVSSLYVHLLSNSINSFTSNGNSSINSRVTSPTNLSTVAL